MDEINIVSLTEASSYYLQRETMKDSEIPTVDESWSDNFGDAVSHQLYEALSQKKVNKIEDYRPSKLSYLTTGSILNHARKNHIVMGAGFCSEFCELRENPHEVLSVRGPRTRKKLLAVNVDCPEVYGDPLILFPLIYNEEVDIECDIGIIPHYIDKKSPNVTPLAKKLSENYSGCNIDIVTGKDYKNFIQNIKKCKYIVSSSLHGVMMGIVYGKKTIFTEFSQNVIGEKFKFYDFFESLDISYEDSAWDDDGLLENVIQVDESALKRVGADIINVCPFIDLDRKELLVNNWNEHTDKISSCQLK